MSRAEDIFQKLIYFGEDAIDEFIMTQQTEELFLDFKQAVSTGITRPNMRECRAIISAETEELSSDINVPAFICDFARFSSFSSTKSF